MRKCVFEDVDHGVQFGGTPGHCTRSRFLGSRSAAITIGGEAADVTLEANEIAGGGSGIVVTGKATARMVKNRLRDTGGPSIDVLGGSSVTSKENVLSNPREIGVRLDGGSRGSFEEEKITGGVLGFTVVGGSTADMRRSHLSLAKRCVSVVDATLSVHHTSFDRALSCALEASGNLATAEVLGGRVERSGEMGVHATRGAQVTLTRVTLRHNGHGEVSASAGGDMFLRACDLTAQPNAIGAFALDGGHLVLDDCRVSGDRAAISASTGSAVEATGCRLSSKKFCIHATGHSAARFRATDVIVPRREFAFVEPGSSWDPGDAHRRWRER